FSQDNTAAQKQKVEEFARQVVEKPFNLMSLPLIRGFLIKLGEGSYVLVMCLHQFLIDGASMHTFYKELSAFYNGDGESLEELKIQYKDYAFWQSQMITKKNIQDQINFWKMELKNAPEQIHLKTDFSRGEEFSYRG
ncbi:MAG: condensation domain-containing protein, partial [bacterium]